MGTPWRPRGPDDLDDEQRARIRYEVLRSLRPLRRSARERLADAGYDAVAILALPAPHVVRALVAALVVVSIVGTATVASADSLPAEPLYGVKLASEQLRLALARTPEDRASVELSMAEHRLAEAVRLVQEGRETEAIGVTSAYGTHLANAAAELASVERSNVASRLVVEQLKQRLAEQQHQAAEMAARFVADPATAVGAELFRTIASFAPARSRDATVSEGIADHAASVAGQIAAVAERLAEDLATPREEEKGAAAPAPGPPAPAVAVPGAPAPAATPVRPRATQRPTQRPTGADGTGPLSAGTPGVGRTGPDTSKRTATPEAAATATPTPKPSPKATVDPKKAADDDSAKAAFEKVLEKVKAEAEKARVAAEKAKAAAKKTPTAKPSPKR